MDAINVTSNLNLGITEVDMVEEFLHQNYELRRNALSKQIEVRELNSTTPTKDKSVFRTLTKETFNSIVLKCRKELGEDVKSPKSIVDELIHSDEVKIYDPIATYLNGLPEWDGKDHVSEFFHRLPNITDKQVYWLSIWLRSTVAHWLHLDALHGNECVPTLISTHQGSGKTTFCKLLLPNQLRDYTLDHINFGNKFDKEIALANNLVVNIDEMDQLSKTRMAELKQTLSKSDVNGRQIYQGVQTKRHRYASFVATTNCLHPLQDPTGSRRFICILIPKGYNILNMEENIDYDQIYAQVMCELKKKQMRYWFTNEETAEIQEANLSFQKVVELDDMIKACFRKPRKDEKPSLYTLNDIRAAIKENYPDTKDKGLTMVMLGRHLTTLGYDSKHSNKGRKYLMVDNKIA